MLIVGIIVVVTAGAPTGALANLLVACFFIWVAVFSVSWSPMPWTISAEIGASALREKTLAVGAFAGFAVGLLTSFVVPYS
jgi:MFS transporter, SP family, sugar:H+ symporter